MTSITRFFTLCKACTVLYVSAHAVTPYSEPAACLESLKLTFEDKKHRNVPHCPVSQKLITWLAAHHSDTALSHQELLSFIENNHDFPKTDDLRLKAEIKMVNGARSDQILQAFQKNAPLTKEGTLAYARALHAHGQSQKLAHIVNHAWQNLDILPGGQSSFLKEFGSVISAQSHARRLDLLLWAGDTKNARDLLNLVPTKDQEKALARIDLIEGKTATAQRLTESSLSQDEGVLFHLAQFYRKRADYSHAAGLLLQAHPSAEHLIAWWKERHYVARELIKQKRYGEALALIENHGLSKGEHFALAEWMTGWLKLRFLNKENESLQHFAHLYNNVRSPISRSRAAYWAGRAEEAARKLDQASAWYKKAAFYKTTFYGQLASVKLQDSIAPTLRHTAQADPIKRTLFHDQDVVKAAHLLAQLGPEARFELRKFIWHIADNARDLSAGELAVELAHHIAPQEVVWAAKKSTKADPIHLSLAFPLKDIPRKGQRTPEDAFVHAFIYQESRFYHDAVSHAGAMGLMQIMPAVAREEAKDLQFHDHSDHKMIHDPEHNMVIGSNHIGRLLEEMGGSYVLTIAAYNAGKDPVYRWLREFGDPRKGEIDIIDWMELITYGETRNYVQRVLENLTVYRSLMGESTRTIIHDLVG